MSKEVLVLSPINSLHIVFLISMALSPEPVLPIQFLNVKLRFSYYNTMDPVGNKFIIMLVGLQ